MMEHALNMVNRTVFTKAHEIFPKALREVILYGSYARGDFDGESDIDVAFIVDMDRREMEKYDAHIVKLISTLSLEQDVLISVNCIPVSEFDRWKNDLPYYRNINTEGIRLSA